MFHYLFVIIFSQGKRFCWWWVQTIITFENQTQCLVLLHWIRVEKKEENSWERVKSCRGTQSKNASEILKITIDGTQWTSWNQMCCSQFSHPWTDIHWCCRRCHSHVCSPYTNISECSTFGFFLARPRSLHVEKSMKVMAGSEHLSIKIPCSQLTPQSYPLTEHTWQGVWVGSLWVLCRARTINVIFFFNHPSRLTFSKSTCFFQRGCCWVTNRSCKSVTI